MTVARGSATGRGRAPMRRETARATIVIGLGSIISAVFVLTPSLPEYLDLVDLDPAGAAAFLVLGAGAVVAGVRRSTGLSVAVAVAFALAALAQLTQLATGLALLGGDASSLALFVAGAAGVSCLLWADRRPTLDLDPRNG